MKREQQLLIEKYIPLKEVGDIILYKKRNLWEKNMTDYDFLSLRLGIGSIPPFFKVNYPAEHFSMEDEDRTIEVPLWTIGASDLVRPVDEFGSMLSCKCKDGVLKIEVPAGASYIVKVKGI